MMIRVKLADLVPGMVTASDVFTTEGRFLLPAGSVLTERSIRLLKAWGLVEAVVDHDGPLPGGHDGRDADPRILAEAREINKKRFMHTNPYHPAIIELERLSAVRRAGYTAEGVDSAAPFDDGAKRLQFPKNLSAELQPINLGRLREFGLRLPTLPAVFDRVNEIIMNPKSSAGDIAQVVSKDSGLTSRLLGIVNSAFYGFVSKVDTVSRAVAIVGTKQLMSLVFGISIVKIFERIPADHIDMRQFWRHSVACGITSRIIAGYKQIQNTERLFVAGLLHDIGRLLLYHLWPEHALYVLNLSRRDSRLLYEVEREVLGMDHAIIGARMAEQWKFPFLLESNILYHHSPGASHNLLEASIINLADVLVNAMEMGSSGEVFVPPLDEAAWNALNISENLLTVIVDHTDRQLDEVMDYFFPESAEGET